MILSQNGYSADYAATVSIRVPGGALRVRGGSVAVVFTHLAQRFNDDVEPLVWPGCWGYADRNIRGSATAVSNHASGTAVDFNAPKHPLGQVGTFTASQRAAIERILADFAPVIRWGGHYSSRKDEMHFEINAPQAAVDALAARLTSNHSQAGSGLPNTSPPEDDMPTAAEIVDELLNRNLTPSAGQPLEFGAAILQARNGAVAAVTEPRLQAYINFLTAWHEQRTLRLLAKLAGDTAALAKADDDIKAAVAAAVASSASTADPQAVAAAVVAELAGRLSTPVKGA